MSRKGRLVTDYFTSTVADAEGFEHARATDDHDPNDDMPHPYEYAEED